MYGITTDTTAHAGKGVVFITVRNDLNSNSNDLISVSRLGDVVVSVLATGPKGCGFEHDQGDGFLRATKIPSTPFFGWEVKPEVPCRKILRHVKDLLMSHIDRLDSHCLRSLSHSLQRCLGWQDCRTVLMAARDVSGERTDRQYRWLPERSGRDVGS
jgi:hypothetical protein